MVHPVELFTQTWVAGNEVIPVRIWCPAQVNCDPPRTGVRNGIMFWWIMPQGSSTNFCNEVTGI